MQINIEDDIYSALLSRAKEQGYKSCEEYMNFLLKQIVEKINNISEPSSYYTDDDREKIKQRLQSLGYID